MTTPFPCDTRSYRCQVISVSDSSISELPSPHVSGSDVETMTQFPYYAGSVGKVNPTLVIEEDLLLAARKIALDQRTSVNQLVRDYLAELIEEPNRRRLARTRLKKMFETGLVKVGEKTWTRDDLHER